jgi:hypothetical protein
VSGIEFRLADPEGELMETIARPGTKIRELTVTYGLALRDMDRVDWPKVNAAIIERWSAGTLDRVKKAAWGQ